MTADSANALRVSPFVDPVLATHDDVVVDVRVNGEPRLYLREFAEPGPGESVRESNLTQSTLAVCVAVALLPLLAAVALLVKLSSRGPVLFRQLRVGQDGELFKCMKFRTMHVDSEERLQRLLSEDDALRLEWSLSHKLQDDPRTTRIGRFLRKTSLDELPQIWNVARGDMSIVGPRPVVPPESVRYGEALPKVLSVKPGITGLWQVSGRNDLSYPERVELDLEYVDKKSLGLDVSICLRTAWVLVASRDKGAY